MGGTIAILYASEDPRIHKLVTWAAPDACKTPWGGWTPSRMAEWKHKGVQYHSNTRTGQQMPVYYQLYRDYEAHRERLDVEKAIRSLRIPVLICHGTHDISVPPEAAVQLQAWQPAAELFMVESNHVFDRKHPWVVTYLPPATEQVLEKTLQFLQQKTPVAGATG
jgi:pimeloyl-ACP methyl ester carboxylesterase